MLATGVVVYASDPVVDELRARAIALLAVPPRADEARLTAMRYAAASQLEDAVDVADRDPATAQLFLNRAVDSALALRFWQAGRWQPRAKELLSELAAFDPRLAADARGFLTGTDSAERLRLAHRIVETTTAASGFFEWKSAPG